MLRIARQVERPALDRSRDARHGKITITKTTGTAARFILPDGYEIPIFRAGKANITERIKVVKKARELRAEVLIAECMAVTPETSTSCNRKPSAALWA